MSFTPCEDLADIANSLEDTIAALEEIGTVNEGDEIDYALKELIEGLVIIAEVECNRQLSQSVAQLSTAWEDMDGAMLVRSLNNVIADFDVIYSNECKKIIFCYPRSRYKQ